MAELDVILTGDIVLDVPNARPFFDVAKPRLAKADVRIGHLETPHTLRGQLLVDAGCPANDPAELAVLGECGFDIMTLAANHIFDRGNAGVEDTLEALRGQGIETAGAGMTLAEAETPAIIERGGVRIGVLSFNCVGPQTSWAGPERAGCAYMHAMVHYEQGRSVGSPPKSFSFIANSSIETLNRTVAALREQADVVIVAFHKGVVHTPAVVLDYEKQVARAAVDAGADAVISHHAHILRGIEVYKGVPIFHGLGNFVTVTLALDPVKAETAGQREYARQRRITFGFEPDPDYPLYPFHPQAKHAMVASLKVTKDGVSSAGFLPCRVLPTGQPQFLPPGPEADAVIAYVQDITGQAGLNARFERQGERVVVS
jgi:poly-gamma-glutamate synthesis protein (capsule biosynthesis protein)